METKRTRNGNGCVTLVIESHKHDVRGADATAWQGHADAMPSDQLQIWRRYTCAARLQPRAEVRRRYVASVPRSCFGPVRVQKESMHRLCARVDQSWGG